MKVAVCQLDIKYEDKVYNLASAKQYIQEASEAGADLIVFPEMSFTGFSMNTDLTGEEDEYTSSVMQELSEEFEIAIGYGWVEGVEECENKYTIVTPDDGEIASYSKIHLFDPDGEDEHFVPGEEIEIFPFDDLSMGLAICYDLRFDDVFEDMEPVTDAVIVAANWPEERIDDWNDLLIERAKEINSYVIGVNCYGEQDGRYYNGSSAVIAPVGKVICHTEGLEDIIYADIEPVE